MNFNNRLKSLRKRSKVTQKAISDHLCITVRTYQRYEDGTIEPPLSTITSIAAYFDMPTDYFIGDGFFSNWDEILLHKEDILCVLKDKIDFFPDGFDFASLTECQLARLLPAIFQKIIVDGNDIHLFPLIPFEGFPTSICADES